MSGLALNFLDGEVGCSSRVVFHVVVHQTARTVTTQLRRDHQCLRLALVLVAAGAAAACLVKVRLVTELVS